MNTQYLPAYGPGDDEDEEGNHRPVDRPEEDTTDAAESQAVAAGAGALVD